MLQNSQKQQVELQQRYTRKLENKNKELERAVFQAKKQMRLKKMQRSV